MSLARIVSGVRSTIPKQTITPCLNKRFISINKSFIKREKEPSFSTNPYNEALGRFKTQAKMVAKMSGYTALSMTTAIAFVWQASHWYIEYVMQPTPSELGYQARNLLHGAYIRETIAPDFEIASFYVREALRIALEEKHLPENSTTVIELRLRLANDETHAGNLLDAITEYTRAWKLMMDKNQDAVLVAETAKHIGDLYLRIGDYTHAEEFLAWSLHHLKDKDALLQSKVTLTLASLYAMQRNFKLALPLLSQTLKNVPEDAVCLKAITQNQLSEAMYGLGKLEESMGWAQAALESCAQDVKDQDCLECGGVASNNLGRLLELKGEFEKALDHYNQAVTYSLSVHDSDSHDRYVLNAERLKDILAVKELEEK
ncbi:hypothetical protein BDF21DRAFT_471135 [Thamnidium elegans]|uniref:Uncharacterized protein n=1 Tax=Thamnidium elegans TaxID=101142 RepID=A0A8H7SR22_9FUNG|nr:hypothetical protein INT48_007694 [Thamnidium elegans]KAI8080899.1 hypothetical protein BDF21DRAFT_471135 [Thamnidium elegans]